MFTPNTPQADCWTLGVILYIMLSSCCPFPLKMDRPTNDLVRSGKFAFPNDGFKAPSFQLVQ